MNLNSIKSILTLRYDYTQIPTLPRLKWEDLEIFGIKTLDDYVQNLENSDGLIIATAHKEFHNIDPMFLKNKMKHPVVIDSKNIIDQQLAKKAGLIYRGIGRGKL